ncbi:MAG TPA: TadG family pilus assembly protein [Planctomycetaceae bacterium]|nr:TadG family pilus assembly protein [Planctomycetaceae bacterium]
MKCLRAIPLLRRHPRRGAVVPLAALLLVVVFSMVAFSVDVGYIVHVDTELQRTADACAFAAVLYLPDQSAARDAANAVAVENLEKDGATLLGEDVVFGVWDRDTATFTPTTSNPNAVRITAHRTQHGGNPLNLFFAPLIGHKKAEVTATSTAMYDHEACGPLIGIDWIHVPGGPTVDSFRSSAGAYSTQTPGDEGSLCSNGPIDLDGNPIINGDANAGPGYQTTLEGGAVVTGNTSPRLRPLEVPGVSTAEIQLNNDNASLPLIQKGNSWVSPVDGDGNFLLDGGKTYTMPPGRYYFNSLTLTGNSNLHFMGETVIYIESTLDTAGGYLFNDTQVANNVKLLMPGGTANITAKVDFYGLLYAPNTAVTLDGGGQYYGAVVGKTIYATGSGDIHYDEDLEFGEGIKMPKRVGLVQ